MKLVCGLFGACAAYGQTFAVIYNFSGSNGDGSGALVQGLDGALYGVGGGGASGDGVIYKVTTSGDFTLLHTFRGSDGSSPGALMVTPTGTFYGTSASGGSNNCGTVFSLTPKGTFSILHDFLCLDGSSPNGNMIRANNGNFYGTTYGGGLNNLGTIFEISKSGTSRISTGSPSSSSAAAEMSRILPKIGSMACTARLCSPRMVSTTSP